MGEFASYKGERIKIGTCENMYYLRADQARLVRAEYGNVDPMAERDREMVRFRFPWPDEDGIEPGAFDDPFKALTIWGLAVPEGVEHYTRQFRADNGYLVSLPCPESSAYDDQGAARLFWEGVEGPIRMHRNGYGGAVQLVQQRYWEGLLVSVCECKGCGAKYRLETVEMAMEAVSLLPTGDGAQEIARRILAGYAVEVDA